MTNRLKEGETAQTATMPGVRVYNGVNRSIEKETVQRDVLVVFDGEELKTVIDLRTYRARKADGASPTYATVWVWPKNGEGLSGSGKARGYGYHKGSAAAAGAFKDAGIVLANRIEGHGDQAVKGAMHAIANACGYADCHIRSII
tara:strand:- start:768 stop:1202 length:435 start_codon:yes stop_codon:yes gene_type:complete